jgi:hypothetical protein
MSTAPSQVPAFREIAGVDGLKVTDIITSPQGNQFQGIMTGDDRLVLTSAAVGTVVVTGPGVIDVSVSGVLGSIGDAILDALAKIKSIISCTPITTTTVNVGSNGQVTSITTTTTCAPT